MDMTNVFIMNGILFLCLVPSLWLFYATLYPKNWKERKLVLGVNNRKEYLEADTARETESIVTKQRNSAFKICVACTVVSAVFLLLRPMFLSIVIWTVYIFAALSFASIPYIIGHKEMISLKRRLGLAGLKGVSYVDLKTAGSIHTLKKGRVLIPLLAGLIPVLIILASDLKLGDLKLYSGNGSFLGTTVMLSIWLVGVMIAVIAYFMDGLKNETISTDSDVNANYNRAKKKNMADMNVACLWVNTVYLFINLIVFIACYSGILITVSIAVYMALLMIELFLYAKRSGMIDKRYHDEMELVADDDEYWIGGMLYYTPGDSRYMIEKRAGIGSTVNFGHPLGKLSTVALAAILLFTVVLMVWIGLASTTPINLRIENEKLICRQLRDEYVIPLSDIQTAELLTDTKGMHFVRTMGIGMDTLLKGTFVVNDQTGCTVFIDPRLNDILHIVTNDGKIYYVTGVDENETGDVYEQLKK